MTDRELLELAAKAAGLTLSESGRRDGLFLVLTNDDGDYIWNPLTNDGDALRLVVKLNLDVRSVRSALHTVVGFGALGSVSELHGDDPYVATRRAIVRAAAAMGTKGPEAA